MLKLTVFRLCSASSGISNEMGSPKMVKLQVAIVGSGPSGCYAADHLLKRCGDMIHIDIYDRLPVPFGLVRYGVAPDHPEVKNVEDRFLKMLTDTRRVTWLGNVDVGRTLSIAQLRTSYHAVILATGADTDNLLRIENEDLGNVLPARRFVNFYNTLPAPYCNPNSAPFDLSKARKAVIIGNGNVALDVARVLGTHYKHWCPTDMNCRAVRDLMNNSITEIDIVARRGVEHASFTTAEFRELTSKFPSDELEIRLKDFDLQEAIAKSDGSRPRKRMLELMHKYTDSQRTSREKDNTSGEKKKLEDEQKQSPETAADLKDPDTAYRQWEKSRLYQKGPLGVEVPRTVLRGPPPKKKVINFLFGMKPVRFVPKSGSPNFVGGVQFEVESSGAGARLVTAPADAVFTSIGYRSEPVRDVPFDTSRGVIPNIAGRVTDGTFNKDDVPIVVPNVYCVGWVKRGPKGVILHAMMDAQETSNKLLEDFGLTSFESANRKSESLRNDQQELSTDSAPFANLAERRGKFDLIEYLIAKKILPVTIKGALRIFQTEKDKGLELGKRLEKVPSTKTMIDIAMGGMIGEKASRKFRGLEGGKPVQAEILSSFLDDETDMRPFAKDFGILMPSVLESSTMADISEKPPGATI